MFVIISIFTFSEARHNPHTPFILLGLKSDLRHDPNIIGRLAEKGLSPVSYESGLNVEFVSLQLSNLHQMAQELGAYRYMECSSLTGEGIKELLDETVRGVVSLPNPNATGKKKHS